MILELKSILDAKIREINQINILYETTSQRLREYENRN